LAIFLGSSASAFFKGGVPGADLSLPAPLSASSFSFLAVSKRFCAAVSDSNAAFFSSSVLATANFF
jgi:hypothetical protein